MQHTSDDTRAGMDRPLVFIHGSGDSASIWRLQLDYLGTKRAYALDLPGHGSRPDSMPPEVGVQDYARFVHDTLRDELHLERPIIAGHSLGGAIALSMGLDYGDELAGLVLIGTGARLRVHPDMLEAARNGSDVGTTATMLYRDLSACNVFDCMARLPELRLPTLIICGTDDRLTPVKYSQYLSEHIPGSTLHIIPNAGHYVMREQPEAVNAAIEAFLSPLD